MSDLVQDVSKMLGDLSLIVPAHADPVYVEDCARKLIELIGGRA